MSKVTLTALTSEECFTVVPICFCNTSGYHVHFCASSNKHLFLPRAHSRRIPTDNFLLTGICILLLRQKQKANLFLLHIHRASFFFKGVLWNSKTSTDAVRITQSDKRSVFLSAVSRNNPSLNKTEVWRDKKQKMRPVHSVLLSSYLACFSLTMIWLSQQNKSSVFSNQAYSGEPLETPRFKNPY